MTSLLEEEEVGLLSSLLNDLSDCYDQMFICKLFMSSTSWIYSGESTRSNYFFTENADNVSSRVERAEHHITLS